MPDAAGRLRQLIGSHTAGGHWDGGVPMSVAQVLGEATVGELADAVHADQIAPLQAERDANDRLYHWAVKRAEAARAALVEIRDRHQRHGDRCASCQQKSRLSANSCDACGFGIKHPCETRRIAERGESTDTEEQNVMDVTHAICDPCWGLRFGDTEPWRLAESKRETESCCWCGLSTESGIFLNVDPAGLLCDGQHHYTEEGQK